MAQTKEEIYQALVAEKEADPALGFLTSTSTAAEWRLWLYVFAEVTRTIQVLWDLFKAEIEGIVSAAQPGTLEWYAKKAKEFQYGDDLQIINNVLTYSTIDPAKQIIARVSVTENAEGEALVKVAKLAGSQLVALSTPELAAFSTYLDRYQFAGSTISAVSFQTDLLKLPLAIYYNPLFDLEGSAGLKARVATKVDLFLKNLPFNGELVINDLEFDLRQVAGVRDAVVSGAQAKANAGVYGVIPRVYQTNAGYIKIDPAFPLTTSVQYLPL